MNTIYKIIALVFLFLYSSYVFKVIIPLAEYFNNYSYIVEYLCVKRDVPDNSCNGMCHLSKEMKNTLNNEEKKDKAVTVEFYIIPHLLSGTHQIYRYNQNNILPKPTVIGNLYEICREPHVPPPKLI